MNYLETPSFSLKCVSFTQSALRAWLRLTFITALSVSLSTPILNAETTSDETHRVFIIGHLKTTPTKISKRALGKIFSGRKRSWESKHKVKLILLPERSREMTWLCADLLSLPEALMRRFLYQRVYRGTIATPVEVNSSDEALETLRVTQGGVGPVLMRVTDAQPELLATQGLQLIAVE